MSNLKLALLYIFLEFLSTVLHMKFELCLLHNNALQCRLCQTFWRFRLFIWLDKLSSPPGHCFFGSEYWHARAGDPLYCVRKAAARSLQYASISSALVFTKTFIHNILDTIRIFLFYCTVHCLVSLNMHCWLVWYPVLVFSNVIRGAEGFLISTSSRLNGVRLLLIFVRGRLVEALRQRTGGYGFDSL
jgi:hypothetical protein